MIRLCRSIVAVAAAGALLGGPGSARADLIAIINPGFESPVTTGFNIGPFTGWALSGSGGGVWNINAAPLGFWTAPAPEGNQIAFVGRDDPPGAPASIVQTLSAVLQNNSVYTLTGFVGHPIGFGATPDPDTVYTIELLAGGAVVGTLSGTGPEGSFSAFQLQFDSSGSALVGQTLGIRLSSSKQQTGFDQIQLDASTLGVPEPSSILLIAMGGAVFLGRRWSSAKRDR